jgi:hypothetical protein
VRELVDRARLERFMRSMGRAADRPGRAYLTGGATAVLEGWRSSTIDVDVAFAPETDALLRAVPALKEELRLNVELVSPAHFIPELPGWEARSAFVAQEGPLAFHHYDFYAQALSKLERGHAKDAEDVAAMIQRGLVERAPLRELFDAIEPSLYRFPAIDPKLFRSSVLAVTGTV